jgi:16S rRNA (uracil1498-N3)-methyltransferase
MARLWRLYHPDLPGRRGEIVSVGTADSHHARKVLRLREGDEIALFDGNGREWLARMVDGEGERILLRLESEILEPEVEPPLEAVLYQSLLRPERMDWVVQKATELGVATLHPFVSERSDLRDPGQRRLERWRRIAVESCKQCGRRRLPHIEPLGELPPAPQDAALALLLQPGARSIPLARLCDRASPGPVLLAVGPESGFTPLEIEAHEGAGWQATELGPRVLRADSAGVIAAAILLHRWGDLG